MHNQIAQPPRILRRLVIATTLLTVYFICTPLAAQMVGFDYGKSRQYGKTVAMDAASLILLSRDGRAYEFPRRQVRNLETLTAGFAPLSRSEMRGALLAEHGHRFEVTGTGNYLVVQPAGTGKQWSSRFEDIYRSVYSYVATRGFSLHAPEFPLVAVVQADRVRFDAYSRQLGVTVPRNVVGYYHPMSNRVVVYDQTTSDGKSKTWEDNSLTIIHETAHQVAHNIGVHSRLGDTPQWVLEGFGTMFEAPGVWNARNESTQSKRVNRYELEMFSREFVARQETGWLPDVVGSDRMFDDNQPAAYAAAWALTFYLSENQPAEYYAFLKDLSDLKPMQAYSSPRRMSDFEKRFGSDWRMLEAQVERFMERL